jgi:hypothetical protein
MSFSGFVWMLLGSAVIAACHSQKQQDQKQLVDLPSKEQVSVIRPKTLTQWRKAAEISLRKPLRVLCVSASLRAAFFFSILICMHGVIPEVG